jgi:hypothetical protein
LIGEQAGQAHHLFLRPTISFADLQGKSLAQGNRLSFAVEEGNGRPVL